MSWWRHVGVAFYDGFVEVFQKVAWTRNLGWGGSDLIFCGVILSAADLRAAKLIFR